MGRRRSPSRRLRRPPSWLGTGMTAGVATAVALTTMAAGTAAAVRMPRMCKGILDLQS